MHYFITGATGYIGWQICQRLLANGHKVTAICRTYPKDLKHPNLMWVKADLQDAESLKKAMKGCTHVFHCGGLARAWARDKNAFFNINVTGTANVLEAAKETGIEKLVFTSTTGVIGRSLSKPMTEDDPRLESFDNDYEISKFHAEQKVLEYTSSGGFAVIVNPSRVFGAGLESPSNVTTHLLLRYIKQNFYLVPGHGNYGNNYVYVQDVVNGHLLAMENGRSGERYILGGENLSYNELYHLFEKLTGLKRMRISISRDLLISASHFLSAFSKITRTQPFITPPFAKKLFASKLLSSRKAQDELGYTITPVEMAFSLTLHQLGFERIGMEYPTVELVPQEVFRS